MKKWQWGVSIFICLLVWLINDYGPPTSQRIIQSIVYSSDETVWFRKLYHSMFNNNEDTLIQTSYIENVRIDAIEPLQDGFIVKSNQLEIRSKAKGIILYTGSSKDFGNIMTVYYDQYNTKVTYGFIRELKQLPYVIVNANDLLGNLNRRMEYFIRIEQGDAIFTEEETVRWLTSYD